MPDQPQRISKREFISRVASRGGWPARTVSAVYEDILGELLETVTHGQSVALTGFGRFYLQTHRGHKVHFGRSDVDDYSVLKFSASRIVNRQLQPKQDADGGTGIENLPANPESAADPKQAFASSA